MTKWESKAMAVTAAMLVDGEIKAIHEPRFVVIEGEHKGKTVYRLFERMLNHKEFIKRFDTLDKAIKFAEKI